MGGERTCQRLFYGQDPNIWICINMKISSPIVLDISVYEWERAWRSRITSTDCRATRGWSEKQKRGQRWSITWVLLLFLLFFVVVLRCHQHSHCNAAVLMVTVALKVGTKAYLQVYTKFGLVVPLPDTSLEKANSLNVHLKHISVNETKHSDCLCLCLMVKRYKPSWRLGGLLRSTSSRTSSVFVFVLVFLFVFFCLCFKVREAINFINGGGSIGFHISYSEMVITAKLVGKSE